MNTLINLDFCVNNNSYISIHSFLNEPIIKGDKDTEFGSNVCKSQLNLYENMNIFGLLGVTLRIF